jgi:protein TonB
MSRRLREQGKVLVRTRIGIDGRALEAQVQESSGFERLDQAAVAAALRWHYTPGTRAGVPQAMWFTLPFVFVLE